MRTEEEKLEVAVLALEHFMARLTAAIPGVPWQTWTLPDISAYLVDVRPDLADWLYSSLLAELEGRWSVH